MGNKSIYSIIDTEHLEEYVKSNLEFFGLGLDSDGHEIERYTRDVTIHEVIANSTDGRLARNIGKLFQDWMGNQIMDAVYEVVDHYVFDEVNKIIGKNRAMVEVPAGIDFEVDNRGYIQLVRSAEFDCRAALDAYDLSELPPEADGFGDGYLDWGDYVYQSAVDLDLVEDWDGPYEFYVTDNDAYLRYMDERVRIEYGYEPREAEA